LVQVCAIMDIHGRFGEQVAIQDVGACPGQRESDGSTILEQAHY
jgi:hypothetical protein